VLQACKARPAALIPLHVFVVMPQPERSEMVPDTYDALAALGAGGQLKVYDGQVQGERKAPSGSSVLADSARAPVSVGAQLEGAGMRVLVAMLMSYDEGDEAKDIRIRMRDSKAQSAQADIEAGERRRIEEEAAKRGRRAIDARNAKATDQDPHDYSDYDITPARYREIYIHSKLLLIDDVYMNVGSANLNARSMAADSELNLSTEDPPFVSAARKRVWGNLAGEDLDGATGSLKDVARTFEDWTTRLNANKKAREHGRPPINGSFIQWFEDPRGAPLCRLG